MGNRAWKLLGTAPAVLLCACLGETASPGAGGGADHDAGSPRPDAGTVATADAGTVAAPTLASHGTYDVDGRWDLSAPIGGERTVGVVAGELLVEQIVAASSVPEPLEAELQEALEERVAPEVEGWVDARAPAALAPDSPLMNELGAVAAQVRYRGELSLEGAGRDATGTERITHLRVDHDGRVHEVAVAELFPAAPGALALETDWRGAVFDDELELEPHVVELRFGLVVLWLAEGVLGADVTSLEAGLADALLCDALVAEITGGTGSLVVDLAVTTVEVPATTLRAACGTVAEELDARAMGMFAVDTPVELEGSVALVDGDRDGRVDTLTSTDDHAGVLMVSGPRALQPRIGVRMTARAR